MSGSSFVRRGLVAALVPLALSSLVACGGDDTEKSSSPTSPTTSVSPSETDSAPAAGENVPPADFVALFEAGFENLTTAHQTMTFDRGGAGTMNGAGDVDYSDSPPAMSFKMTGSLFGASGMDMRMVDGMMYMQIPGMSDGKYVKFDLSDPSSPLGALGAQLDPQAMFASFEKGIESVTFVGQEDVDGESLDHYSVVVDSNAILESLGQTPPGGGALGDQITYEFWLDGDHRLRQMTTDMGALGSMKMTVSDFGKDVSIEAPSPDQVTQMPGSAG